MFPFPNRNVDFRKLWYVDVMRAFYKAYEVIDESWQGFTFLFKEALSIHIVAVCNGLDNW